MAQAAAPLRLDGAAPNAVSRLLTEQALSERLITGPFTPFVISPGRLLRLFGIPLAAFSLIAQQETPSAAAGSADSLAVAQKSDTQLFREYVDRWIDALFEMDTLLHESGKEKKNHRAGMLELLNEIRKMQYVDGHYYFQKMGVVSARDYEELDAEVLKRYKDAYDVAENLIVDAGKELKLAQREPPIYADESDQVRGWPTGVRRIYRLRFYRELSALRKQVEDWNKKGPDKPAIAATIKKSIEDLARFGMPPDQTTLWLKHQIPEPWKNWLKQQNHTWKKWLKDIKSRTGDARLVPNLVTSA